MTIKQILFSVLVLGSIANKTLSIAKNFGKDKKTAAREFSEETIAVPREFPQQTMKWEELEAELDKSMFVVKKYIAKVQAYTALDEAITVNLKLNHEQQ